MVRFIRDSAVEVIGWSLERLINLVYPVHPDDEELWQEE